MELSQFLTGLLGGFIGFVVCYLSYRLLRGGRRKGRRRTHFPEYEDPIEDAPLSVLSPKEKGCESPGSMAESLIKELDYELMNLRNGKQSYRIFLKGCSYSQGAIDAAIKKFMDAGWPTVDIYNDKKGLLCIIKM